MDNFKKVIPSSILVQLGFLAIILFIFILLCYNLNIFFPGLLGAICLFVLLLQPYRWLHEQKKWNSILSIITLILGSALLIITPLILLINTLTQKVLVILEDKEKISQQINGLVSLLNDRYKIDVFDGENLGKAAEIGMQLLESILNASANSFMQIGVAYLLVFFMLSDYLAIQQWVYKFIPFKKENIDLMGAQMKKLVLSNAIGVPLTAFIQGIIAYVGYLIFGVDDAFVFFVFTSFAAMIPVVGAAVIYIPIAIILLAQGQASNAIGLLIYCIVIVGSADNLVRFVLQKKMADVHPLITIFGVIVGVNLYGFIGIIFGPILFSLFIWLLKLYQAEFTNGGTLIKKTITESKEEDSDTIKNA